MTSWMQRRQEHINKLPPEMSNRLPSLSFEKFDHYRDAMHENQDFLNEIILYYLQSDLVIDGGETKEVVLPDKFDGETIPYAEQKRNEAILHSVYREWSKEGAEERNKSFLPIVNTLKELLPVSASNAYKQRVLVPGCGTGRLPIEIAASGYSCEGNEFSAFMVMTSNFMLNGVVTADEFNIHPWLDR
jgi:carnosine N-methyltransferase